MIVGRGRGFGALVIVVGESAVIVGRGRGQRKAVSVGDQYCSPFQTFKPFNALRRFKSSNVQGSK